MKPIDAALSVLGLLDEKEREQIRRALACPALSPCAKLGHKYRKAGQVMESVWKPAKTQFLCERCGAVLIVG